MSRLFSTLFLSFFLLSGLIQSTAAKTTPIESVPSVLVLFDGPDQDANPGRLDALYLVNLLGHFTTHRVVHSLDTYQTREAEPFDAVFVVVYQKRYRVPAKVLEDLNRRKKVFCWIGNQAKQLEERGLLSRYGIRYAQLADRIKFNQVLYKGRTLAKGDPETNLFEIVDAEKAKVLATVSASGMSVSPYVIQSGNLWLFADSPFSYSSENDRYLVLCDLLHDILRIQHAEQHPALLRIEDINAMSNPAFLQATLDVIRKKGIPFSFGFVPMYVDPQERTEFRLADKSDVVHMLVNYVKAGGTPVLHGYTHQYRGVTTDDYEFWDDLSDRPVRGDSEAFATHRVTEAIKESMALGIYPVTWETPHYAASPLDYRVFHRFFNTVYERRLAGSSITTDKFAGSLNSDQFFPYPVIDRYGQYVIPESLAYVPIDDQRSQPILQNADAAYVVRDGYASVFFHPFLKPQLLEEIIVGIQQRGFHFADLREFPNEVKCEGRVVSTRSGTVEISGHGHYLNEFVFGSHGQGVSQNSLQVDPRALLKRTVHVPEGDTYVALRQEVPAPSALQKLLHLAKGDISVIQRKLGTVLPAQSNRNPVKTIILWDAEATGEGALDQESFAEALNSIGFDVEKIDYSRLMDEDLGPFSMIVIPWTTATSLPPAVVDRIVTGLNGGITLITDGESPLSQGLGIRLGEPIAVNALQDHLFVNQETRWPDRVSVPWIAEPTGDQADVYYSDRDTQHPLVISQRKREGRYLYFAPLFDSVTGKGYGRFPNLPQILIGELRVTPMATRMAADVYFDPGYRQSISIEVLARMWRRFGIRAVHVAAWHFYDKYAYDYSRLVKVAHQNGILVYAWFEWPEVSEQFWTHHPKWREKTADLADAHVDWRFLMNLQEPDCMKAVLKDLQSFMRHNEWDGVDIGELTFESPSGPEEPHLLTPFNAQARHEFQGLQHFDPVELFDTKSPHYWRTDAAGLQAFYQYRRDVNSRLLRTFLTALTKWDQKKNRQWDLVVTMLDALQHPDLGDFLGIDVNRTVALVNHFGATLQVEDPAPDWSKAPERYVRMGERYKGITLKKPFMIDINVLPVHSLTQKGFATAQPTGIEMSQLWRSASSQATRVCFYSESTVYEHDWEMMPFAMAARSSLKREGDNWIVDTPNTVRLDVAHELRRFRLDGQPWYCNEKGAVLIPQGKHVLTFSKGQTTWFDTSQLATRLLSITGELVSSQRIPRGLEVVYDSPMRCAMMFSKAPYKMLLDGVTFKGSVVRGDDGFTVLAPPGHHQLRVLSETASLYAVEFTSVVAASLIVLFGIASSGLLALLFLFIVIRRRFRRFIGAPSENEDEEQE